MKRVLVFCGSKEGISPAYKEVAAALGKALAVNGMHLIYGGGKVGLMGVLANAALEAGGQVTGIIPHFLMREEVGHGGLTDLQVVESMHERKQKMVDQCDVIIALPGGIGTLDEWAEMLTWKQLKIHQKVMVMINTEGYFDHLLGWLDHTKKQGFLSESVLPSFSVVGEVDEAVLLIKQEVRVP